MGVEVCGVVFPLVLAFLFDRVCGGRGWGEWSWVRSSGGFVVRFREEGMIDGRVGTGVVLEVGGVRLLRRENVREVFGDVVVRSCTRLCMNVSSSPVSRYFRWDLEMPFYCYIATCKQWPRQARQPQRHARRKDPAPYHATPQRSILYWRPRF